MKKVTGRRKEFKIYIRDWSYPIEKLGMHRGNKRIKVCKGKQTPRYEIHQC